MRVLTTSKLHTKRAKTCSKFSVLLFAALVAPTLMKPFSVNYKTWLRASGAHVTLDTQKYVVLSLNVRHQDVDPYSFCLPFVVAAWKRLGWRAIVAVVHNTPEEQDGPGMRLLKSTIAKLEPKTTFVVAIAPRSQGVTLAQIVRLFGATYPWIANDDILATSDIDILPLLRPAYDYQPNTVAFLNSGCCGSFQWNEQAIPMYPMTNVIGTKLNWMKLMDLSDSPHPDESNGTLYFIQDWLKNWHGISIPEEEVEKGDNDHWYLDQRILSIQAAKHIEIPKLFIERDTSSDRIDRSRSETWPRNIGAEQVQTKVDMHMFLPGHEGRAWEELKFLVKILFDSQTQIQLLQFRNDFIKTMVATGSQLE